ncbi:Holliday junction branch migration protein RuvA [Serpentinicella sp. ANB-PHB4]|uniref:Holliday junction branch migration protein RuvA n=1 Tax=Serpentinicella sp. ANB-PHB4 TaxID=3074076 RepID=UPI00285C0938|nr:Holliday junction branch migration protein RuvA [Serpentinicella sp. ANB-PHB4]MDR5658055.1 Holliday junction branch migration protein RuvA [Serpentinicella sp. ANB-PHB4]
MFEFLKGKVTDIFLDKVILEVNGIGYRINSTMNSASNLTRNEDVLMYTYLQVREDELNLYGFVSRDELEMFKKLISVSKIGPKVAATILSTYTTVQLRAFIINKDIAAVSKTSGVGKKTAERIILELKDKISLDESETTPENAVIYNETDKHKEVLEALLALGYSKSEIHSIVKSLDQELSVEEMIKYVLQQLM